MDDEDRRIFGILEAHCADMDVLEALELELEDKCFDQLAVMEERAEAEALLEELAGEPVDRDLVDAFLDELPAQ
jgi:hypothetical protein